MTVPSLSRFRLAWVQAFGTTVELGSASAAAVSLGCHQTTISRDLKELSVFLKGPLFEEGKLPLTLTPLGNAFFPKAIQVMEWAQECRKLNDTVSAQIAAQEAAATSKPRKRVLGRLFGSD